MVADCGLCARDRQGGISAGWTLLGAAPGDIKVLLCSVGLSLSLRSLLCCVAQPARSSKKKKAAEEEKGTFDENRCDTALRSSGLSSIGPDCSLRYSQLQGLYARQRARQVGGGQDAQEQGDCGASFASRSKDELHS